MGNLLILFGVPSAITGLALWYFQKMIDKREKAREEHEQNLEQLMLYLIQQNKATNILATATARAVQRIPDAHCNGDMSSALDAANKIQQEENNFLLSVGVKSII